VKDDKNYDVPETSIVDLMEPKGLTWKSYQEDYPSECFTDSNYKHIYYRKHNPFISFDNIRNNRTRCALIVNSDQLFVDVKNDNLPNLMYYTPNIKNDGHDTGVAYADKWLANWLPHFLLDNQFMTRTLIVLTFDEDDSKHDNRVYTLLLGSGVKPNAKDDTLYTHYSLLRTMEDNFGLGTLHRQDEKATPFLTFKS
jgi:hypothetical protein